MKRNLTRRGFLKGSAGAAVAAGLAPWAGLSARSYAQVVGSNEDLRIAVIGFNQRGREHIQSYRKIKGVRIVALCDADEAVLNKEAESLASPIPTHKPATRSASQPATQPAARAERKALAAATTGPASRPAKKSKITDADIMPLTPIHPTLYTDVRKLLDSKEVDAISTATPNHWHSLIGIWACQAGKDAYIEKPISHNIWEGRKLVEAAERYKRVVAAGTQNRSNEAFRDAFDWVRAGHLGKIKVARGLCYKRRASIGKVDGPQPVPAGVDYDLWCGPSPKIPLMRKHLHYDWHWVWPTGNGDLGNQGIHHMDLARWALGQDRLAPRAFSIGGRFGYVDDGETPNTQMVVLDYGPAEPLLIFEVRGLPEKAGSKEMDEYKKQSVNTVIECEGGYLSGTTAYDNDGKEIRAWEEDDHFVLMHFMNFVKAVRDRKPEMLTAPILQGHVSSGLCHMGNISHRLGRQENPEAIRSAIKSNKAAGETFDRFEAHLAANEVDLKKDEARLGAFLELDPATERFVGNEKANELLKDEYRAPFVVPENV